jgi:hypothetical protein
LGKHADSFILIMGVKKIFWLDAKRRDRPQPLLPGSPAAWPVVTDEKMWQARHLPAHFFLVGAGERRHLTSVFFFE